MKRVDKDEDFVTAEATAHCTATSTSGMEEEMEGLEIGVIEEDAVKENACPTASTSAACAGGGEIGMMEEDAVRDREVAGTEFLTKDGGPSLYLLHEHLLKVSRSSDNEFISKFFKTVETSMKGDRKTVEDLLNLLLQEENEIVIKFYVLLMEKYMYFDNWRYWMGSGILGNNPLVSESLMMRMKDPSNIHRILQMFKTADKTKLGTKELLGDLLVCMSMPRMFRNDTTVYFSAEHEVWAYTVQNLRSKEKWIDGLMLCNCFLKKCHEHSEILQMLTVTCKFLPQLPKLITHTLFSHEHKTSDEIQLAVNCLFGLAQLASSSTRWYTYNMFYQTMACTVNQLSDDKNYEGIEALCNGLSTAMENLKFDVLFTDFSVLIEFFLALASKRIHVAGLWVAALNVVITGFAGISRSAVKKTSQGWKSNVVTWLCYLILKETDVPAELIYFDLASWKEEESSVFVSSIRLLELVVEKVQADTFFDLAMPQIEHYMHDICYNSKFAAYVILGVAIGAGNMRGLSVSPYRRIWDTALELEAFGQGAPSATMAGMIFAINEACKYQPVIAMANSAQWMLDSLKLYFAYLVSCLEITPADASLQSVTMQTLNSLAAVVDCHNADDVTKEHEWKTITGSLLNELGCHKLCYVVKQTALYGVLRFVDQCGHLAVHYYGKICETLMTYMAALVEEENCICEYKVHASLCGIHDKSRSYEYCVDIMQSLLLEMTSPDYTFFHNIFVRIVNLYYTVDDPDLHTSILKYLTTFCSKFGTSMNTQMVESIVKLAIQSLQTDDGTLTINMCNMEYSKYFASKWKKYARGPLANVRISVWGGHFRSHEDKLLPLEIPHPYQAERMHSIKLIQTLCYNISKRFHPYLESTIELLTQAVHDTSIAVRIQALESLSNFVCYKQRVDAAECTEEIYSTARLALEFIQRNSCVELMIASMESIEMFLKYCKIPTVESKSIWSAISDILLAEEDYFDSMKNQDDVEEVGRILELRKLCFNVIPQFAKTMPNAEFAGLFFADNIIDVFENTLSPKWSMLPSGPNSKKVLDLQIDAVGVIGDLLKHIGDHLPPVEAHKIFIVLNETFKSDDRFMRCNTMYSVGEIFFRCDRQFVWRHIPKVSKTVMDCCNRFENNVSPLEAAQCLGSLAKMGLARINMVVLRDVLEVTFSYLPLTEDLDEYEHVLGFFVMLLKSPLYQLQLHPYFQRILEVCEDIYLKSSLLTQATIVELAKFLENEIRTEVSEEENVFVDIMA